MADEVKKNEKVPNVFKNTFLVFLYRISPHQPSISKYKCQASLMVFRFNIQFQYIIKRKSYDLTDKMITKGKICSDPLSDCLSYSVRRVDFEKLFLYGYWGLKCQRKVLFTV